MVYDHYESWCSLCNDEPGKPWTVACECGYISWHKTEKAAMRALGKHRNDTSLFEEQVRVAEGRVELATQTLHRVYCDLLDAKLLLRHVKENQPKKRKRNAKTDS